MGGLEHGPCPGMARVGMDDGFREMDRVYRTARGELCSARATTRSAPARSTKSALSSSGATP